MAQGLFIPSQPVRVSLGNTNKAPHTSCIWPPPLAIQLFINQSFRPPRPVLYRPRVDSMCSVWRELGSLSSGGATLAQSICS